MADPTRVKNFLPGPITTLCPCQEFFEQEKQKKPDQIRVKNFWPWPITTLRQKIEKFRILGGKLSKSGVGWPDHEQQKKYGTHHYFFGSFINQYKNVASSGSKKWRMIIWSVTQSTFSIKFFINKITSICFSRVDTLKT